MWLKAELTTGESFIFPLVEAEEQGSFSAETPFSPS
jgi:hypothetical protein